MIFYYISYYYRFYYINLTTKMLAPPALNAQLTFDPPSLSCLHCHRGN